MKKKDLFAKGLLCLSSAGIIAASCSGEDLWTESDEDTSYIKLFRDKGRAAIPIKLSNAEIQYLDWLNKLGQDIIKEPAVARQFVRNPNMFVQQYGYKGEINLEEGMLKLILALGDEEINTAINNKDITTALTLMEDKGILDDISESDYYIKFSVEEIRNIYTEMGINIDDEFLYQQKSQVVAVFPVYVIAAVVSQAALVYNAAAAINAAAVVNAVVASNVYLITEVWGAENSDSIVSANFPLKIWSLKGQDKNTYIAADLYVSNLTKKIIGLTQKNNPNLFKYIKEKDLEQIVKINIVNAGINIK